MGFTWGEVGLCVRVWWGSLGSDLGLGLGPGKVALLAPLKGQKGHSRGIRGHWEFFGDANKILWGTMEEGHRMERATGKLLGPPRKFYREPLKKATEWKGPLREFCREP